MWHLFLPYTWIIAKNTGVDIQLELSEFRAGCEGKESGEKERCMVRCTRTPTFYIVIYIRMYEDMLYSRITVWYNMILTWPNKMAQAVMLLTCILQMFCSNLGLGILTRLFVVLLHPPTKIPEQWLQLRHGRSLLHAFKLISHCHPVIARYVIRVTESADRSI
jgi:hypothetical protein